MKMKKIYSLFLMIILTCQTSMGQIQNQPWPEKPTETEWAPIPYSMIKYTFWNAEKFVNKTLGLTSQYCQYTSLRTNKTYKHTEIGACTYHHLIDSMYSEKMQAPVFIWAQNNNKNPIILKMLWRPHKGSLLEILNSFLELQYEDRIELQRRLLSFFNIDSEKIQEKFKNRFSMKSTETLVGEMSLQFKLDQSLWENIKILLPAQLQAISQFSPHEVSEVNIQMKASGRSQHYIQNNVTFEILSPTTTNVLFGEIKTNVNILNTERMFNASGQLTIKAESR